MSKRPTRKGAHKHIQRVPGGADDYVKAQEAEALPEHELTADDIVEDDRRSAKRYVRGGHVSRAPHLDQLFKSVYVTCYTVLRNIQERVLKAERIDSEDLRAFTKVAGDVLPKLIREERAQQKAEGWDELDVKELLELNEEAERVLREGSE